MVDSCLLWGCRCKHWFKLTTGMSFEYYIAHWKHITYKQIGLSKLPLLYDWKPRTVTERCAKTVSTAELQKKSNSNVKKRMCETAVLSCKRYVHTWLILPEGPKVCKPGKQERDYEAHNSRDRRKWTLGKKGDAKRDQSGNSMVGEEQKIGERQRMQEKKTK